MLLSSLTQPSVPGVVVRLAFLVALFAILNGGGGAAQALAGGAELHTYSKEEGPLAGKHVVISPGHGRHLDGGWDRPLMFGLREDIHVNEIPIIYLQRYLHNAGATVHLVRERSFQSEEIIVDVTDPGYSEQASANPSMSWQVTTTPPFGRFDPYRFHAVTTQDHASARWTPNFPQSGMYPVYVNVVPGGNRATDALYRVHHAGGTTELRFDQSAFPESWVYLGTFFFLEGEDEQRGSLELSTQADTGNVVIAGAVRFGSGEVQLNSGVRVPRWYAQAYLTLDHYGYPNASFATRLSSRPRYGSWMAGLYNEPSSSWSNDWRFLSIHTNANGGVARGTRTFVYSNGRTPAWGTAGDPTHAPTLEAASDSFGDRMHNQFVDDIRGLWEATWSGGVGTAQRMNFSELRNCEHMPSCLIELAFHDNETDAGYIRIAQWRHDAARAMYKGLLRDFDPTATVLPLPPSNVRITQSNAGEYTVAWTATDDPLEASAAPDEFKVYRSSDGYAWDNGTLISSGNSATFSADPGEVVYVRVAALNDGGESLPSKAVGASIAEEDDHGGVLIVDGFTSTFIHVVTTASPHPSNVLQRYRDNYVVKVLEGLEAQEEKAVPVDSALAEAVEAGLVDLKNYHAVIWFLGNESDETFSEAERAIIVDYLENAEHANLFVSGSRLAAQLDANGTSDERAFLQTHLGAEFDASNTATHTAQGAAGTPFENLTLTYGDGTSLAWGDYDVNPSDRLASSNGSITVLTYDGGSAVAALLRSHTRGEVLTMGFPVERIVDQNERASLMGAVVSTLLADYTPPGTAQPGSKSRGCASRPGNEPPALHWYGPLLALLGLLYLRLRSI